MITIYSWFGFTLPIGERFRLIRRAGFDGVLLWWGDDFGNDGFRTYPRYARKEGLYIEDIHIPFEGANNLWLDNQAGESVFENLLACVGDCSDHNIPTMIVHLSGGDNPPPPCAKGLDRIKRIVEKAERLNVNVAVENLRKTGHIAYVFSEIPSKRLGFCYDSGHHHCRTPDENILGKYGSRLMALHLHDNDGYFTGNGEEDQHKMPFDGSIGWTDTMKKIAMTGFSGATALEVVNFGYEHLVGCPEEFLRIACERARKLEELRKVR